MQKVLMIEISSEFMKVYQLLSRSQNKVQHFDSTGVPPVATIDQSFEVSVYFEES